MRDVTPKLPAMFETPIEITDEIVDDLCVFVGSGGSPIRWCELKRLDYGSFMNSMKADRQFALRYAEAEASSRAWEREAVLDLIKEIMLFNPAEAFDEHGNILPMHKMPTHVAKMIKKSKTIRSKSGDDWDEVDSLEYFDKQKAIDQLGKFLQMFIDRTEVTHKLTLEETIAKAREGDK